MVYMEAYGDHVVPRWMLPIAVCSSDRLARLLSPDKSTSTGLWR